jgi:hypothetical protein
MNADKEITKSGFMKVAPIIFLCEQQGRPEDELKQLFSGYFKSELAVSSAFLLRVKYGSSAEQQVALCIRGDGLDRHALLEHTSRIFRAMFNTEQTLDIIFLNSEQEQQALSIGKPFYIQTARQA